MAHARNHDFHILNPSILPFVGALGGFTMLAGMVLYMHDLGPWLALIGLSIVLYVMYAWWSQVIVEGNEGDHTPVVMIGIRYGVILFITSEVMFFVAWFWNFFKHAMYPASDNYPAVNGVWPPAGIETLDAWHLPVINTLVLLCSGAAATWAHHALSQENNRKDLINGLILAILLGVLFTTFQAYEYSEALFSFTGNIYGATFFMATGFHGFHVIIGTIFLTVCLIRAIKGQMSPEHHLGLEAATWYWHFVDVVWLFLFAAVYVWGS